MIEEIKKMLADCTPDEQEKIRKWLWDRKTNTTPTITCKMGQIISWTNTQLIPFSKEAGFALEDNHEQKSIIVMQYLKEYGCLRQTRIDGDKCDLKVHDKFVDLAELFLVAE